MAAEDFQDSPDDEEDTRSSQEYLNDLEEEYQVRALLAKSKRFFKKGTPSTSAPKSSMVKNQGLIDKTCEWDGKEVSSDDNEMVEVKVLMALADDNVVVSKEGARNGEWVKIYMRKCDIRKPIWYLDSGCSRHMTGFKSYLHKYVDQPGPKVVFGDDSTCITKGYGSIKCNGIVHTKVAFVNGLKYNLISISQLCDAKYIVQFDKKRGIILQKKKKIKKTTSNNRSKRNNLSSKHRNLVQELNTCKEYLLILNQAKLDLLTMLHVNTEILKENQNLRNEVKELTSVTETWLNSSNKFWAKRPVFVKSLADNSEVSITGSNKPKLFEAEDYTLSNHDTGKHPLPPLEKLAGAKPVPGPKTIKSNLKSNPTFKAETLKGITLKEPSSAPAKDNKKGSSASKTSSALVGKLKNVPHNSLQNRYKTQFKISCELCGENNHLSENCFRVLFCKKCKRTDHRTCDHAEFMSSLKTSQHHTSQGESSLRSRPSRPVISFPSCIHYGYNDHQSNDCVYYPRCELCGSYDHDTQNHNRIISLRRGIKPRNPQQVTKDCETCGSNAQTTTDHNDIEWFRKGEAKKAEVIKTTSLNV
ncbi:hypothetical protein Tco_1043377 [Tanacetum coccineum]|uniref:Retrovirus-related Pol polyprotein from transposon TNT 1-94-like beta-barrel domain-containing protein n=1 Tax=Tanacetum coccineum TaxID=301880 RepID=A0ABQ5GLX9_9ASTR